MENRITLTMENQKLHTMLIDELLYLDSLPYDQYCDNHSSKHLALLPEYNPMDLLPYECMESIHRSMAYLPYLYLSTSSVPNHKLLRSSSH